MSEENKIKELELQLKKIKLRMDVPIPKTEYKTPNKTKKYYLIPISIIILTIIFLFLVFMSNIHFLYKIMISILLTPVFIGMSMYFIIRIYWDRKKIQSKIIKNLSKNFIIANFFLTQKRIIKRVCLIKDDGISFNIKDKLYILDFEKIWYDENNYPNSFYIPNYPNPLGFDFLKHFKGFIEQLKKGEEFKDEYGNLVDVTYDSQSLDKFKKDKFFTEMHKQITPEMLKIIYIMGGLLALSLGVVFLMVIYRRPVVNVEPTIQTPIIQTSVNLMWLLWLKKND